jgi:hypothetical protein
MYKRAVKMVSVWESDPEHLEWRARRIFNNMKNCSCWMCCGERRNEWYNNRMKLSKAEQRAEDNYNDWMDMI